MEKLSKFYGRHAKRLNLAIIGLILLINGYTLLAPLWPQVDLWLRRHHSAAVSGLPYDTKLNKTPAEVIKRAPAPSDNRLVIPDIALNDHIITGSGAYLINLGVWNRPNTSTPPAGGNTVLVAHRYNYTGASNFYSLGNVKVGDKIVVYWQRKEYDYTVKSNRVVVDTDLSVEAPTAGSRLTLYTCTPIWDPHPKYRIVVTALLDGGYSG